MRCALVSAVAAALVRASAAADVVVYGATPGGIMAAVAADVVVYGATPGGIMAAVAAANGTGLAVTIIHPLPHIGGMTAGGLGQTDIGNSSVVGGLARDFFARICAAYGRPGSACYTFEPHVAEAVFLDMLQAAGATLVTGQTLTTVAMNGTAIASLTVAPTAVVEATADPSTIVIGTTTYSASVFIDGSYEGDLVAASGVSVAWGREAASQYNESLAGRLFVPNDFGGHQFNVPVNYTWPNGEFDTAACARRHGAVLPALQSQRSSRPLRRHGAAADLHGRRRHAGCGARARTRQPSPLNRFCVSTRVATAARRRSGHQGASVQLPHVLLQRPCQPGPAPQACQLRPGAVGAVATICQCHGAHVAVAADDRVTHAQLKDGREQQRCREVRATVCARDGSYCCCCCFTLAHASRAASHAAPT